MIRIAALAAFMATPVWADADPGPIPDMADVARLRACLSNQPVETASSCRLRVFTPCAEARGPDPDALRLCHLAEADAWDFIRIKDSWPRAVAAAQSRDEVQGRDESGVTGLDGALRATRPAWLAYRDTYCALATVSETDAQLGGVAGTACWSRITAERVLELTRLRQNWMGND